ncbi:MAG: phage tail tape measure protein [Lachnospiraceae bacterium]
MAKLSSQFASISPGMTVNEAQEGLVSIIKAWGINVDDVEREVMDNINQLGNRFAESNIDLVNGMKRAAAALAATGTTYQEAFALFTGAQEVLQNAEVGGRALRSVSMRIRGYSESSEDGLEEADEELKNITGDLIDITKTAEHSQGVSIFKEGSSTEFKSLVDYFGEIKSIWSEMSQKQQNDFLNKAFGKNQAQAGAALIQNYEAIANAMKAMENAAGSSDREMGIITESLDYKLNRLKETWGTGIAQNLFEREDMKSLLDFLTKIGEGFDAVTSKLGLFGTIGVGAGVFGIRQIVKNFA